MNHDAKPEKLGRKTRLLIGVICLAALMLAGVSVFVSHGHSQTPTATPAGGGGNLLVRPDSAKIGPDSAAATLVEFGGYQCPACGSYYPVLKQLVSTYPDKLKFVFRNYPLPEHKNGYLAAQAAEAAGLQGKFWEMHDRLYETQSVWAESNSARDTFVQYAQSLGLDVAQFTSDMDSAAVKQKIDRDIEDGDLLRVDGTPTFYLNGVRIQNPPTYDAFRTLIDAALVQSPAVQAAEDYHSHVDFKVYIEGKALDFGAAQYQSTDTQEIDPWMHLHDGNGTVLHVHKRGIALDEFFKSVGMNLTGSCFTVDSGQQYCNSSDKTLKMFVNGKPNTQFGAYVPQDLDRILISYGSESGQALQTQIASVTDEACIYSLKCPERGKPPTESCVGGLGTKCSK